MASAPLSFRGNATPGGPVAPEDYAGEGVYFPPGTALVQNNSALADTNKMTFSLWFAPLVNFSPPANTDTDNLFSITKENLDEGDDVEDDCYIRIATLVTGTPPLGSRLKVQAERNADPAFSHFLAVTGQDTIEQTADWRHLFVTINTSASPAVIRTFIDGEEVAIAQTFPFGTIPFLISVQGKNIGFPQSSDLLAIDDSTENYFSDVQIWFGQAIDPAATQTIYSAKASASRAIRDLVNYVNSRGVSPLEALAVMNIESDYARLSRNYFQFLQPSAFNLILGYTGVTTNNTDLNRAFANAWLGLRPNGSVVGAPNNYDRLVRQITADVPFGWQKYLIHNLGGSVSEVGAAGSINGYRLLTAWVDDDTLTLGEVGGLTLMTAQAKIWGSTGPIGTVTNATTVGAAIDALITVWNAAETDALRFLDASTKSNLSYFIDDDGFAVPPAAATDKFGLQTFLFTGDAEDFIVNQGSGGDVTLVGAISDVPGPND
jgi:hypothetical protein